MAPRQNLQQEFTLDCTPTKQEMYQKSTLKCACTLRSSRLQGTCSEGSSELKIKARGMTQITQKARGRTKWVCACVHRRVGVMLVSVRRYVRTGMLESWSAGPRIFAANFFKLIALCDDDTTQPCRSVLLLAACLLEPPLFGCRIHVLLATTLRLSLGPNRGLQPYNPPPK